MSEARIIRCSIEMDLIEGEHFNPNGAVISDKEAIRRARNSFVDTLESEELEYDDWVQCKIVEENS